MAADHPVGCQDEIRAGDDGAVGAAGARHAAEVMGAVLGWDAAVRMREVEHYLARVAAERESQRMPDDATADAARMGAEDVRGFAADRGLDVPPDHSPLSTRMI